ncbi:subtilisin-like serine protease [Ceratobasidium sp. 394]|nr:subtilisin-like serine protease [Ceratobasidium sp. 394]
MRASFFLVLVGSTICSTLAAPGVARTPITKRAGPAKSNSYLVKLKPGVSKATHLAALSSISGSALSYTYDQAFQGYSIQLQGKALDYIRGSKDVEYIVQDEIVNIKDSLGSGVQLAERRSAPIHESHLSKRTGGSGVDVYQIDTGIYTVHTQFGGRAKWGATFGGYPNADGNGHGTTLASLAVGSTYGPANKANITAIKAFGDDGSANLSDIIAGINWVITTVNTTNRPSLILITVTIAGYKPFDDAVASATNKGIHVVVAAGDSNEDASTISPARAASAVTVGAILANGTKLSTSNFGTVVDIWGPGANAKCAWISSPTASITLVGTTASAGSNVAGILAIEIEKYGNKAPAALEADLKSHAKTVNGYLVAQQW